MHGAMYKDILEEDFQETKFFSLFICQNDIINKS